MFPTYFPIFTVSFAFSILRSEFFPPNLRTVGFFEKRQKTLQNESIDEKSQQFIKTSRNLNLCFEKKTQDHLTVNIRVLSVFFAKNMEFGNRSLSF